MKIYYYTVFSALLMILFYIAGFNLAVSSWIFTKLGILDLQNYSNYTFWATLVIMFGVSVVGGIIAGIISNISPTFIIKGIYIMGILTTMVLDFINILVKLNSYGNSWVYWVVLTIFAPLIAGYAIALIEFWEGRD